MKKISKLFAFLICLSAACGVFAAQSFSEVKSGAVSEKVGTAVNEAKASAASVPSSQYFSSSSLIKDVTDADFNKEVLNYKGVVVVDFWGTKCEPCEQMSVVIEKVAKDYKGKVKFVKMRSDVSMSNMRKYMTEYAKKYDKSLKEVGVPFIIFFKNGVAERYINGFRASSAETNIRDEIRALL
ncbi:thioredoxin family protein [Candidatus Proelusimicrobium excrementi]|uniref:thioredoxin family protein n=1 Tax=Candidatus Proelusimicrobium excrementi TaxID=3416222 RepID=UPI003C81581B|nr:hypothetical protein [Elusimicrobiaceae bacterium]